VAALYYKSDRHAGTSRLGIVAEVRATESKGLSNRFPTVLVQGASSST